MAYVVEMQDEKPQVASWRNQVPMLHNQRAGGDKRRKKHSRRGDVLA